jgi:hypothetical protein
MDNAKHLYTVLAIMGFLALPVLMNSERVTAFDGFATPRVEMFSIGTPFPGDRKTRPLTIEPAASAFEQRWIDESSRNRCKPAAAPVDGSHAPGKAPANRCLIV